MALASHPRLHRVRQQHATRSSVSCQAFTTQTTRPVVKDATAELLQAAIKFALQQRLRTHKGIEVDVQSNALDLMTGRFGGLTVDGQGWCTPLQLTAQSIQVSVGELMIDQGALLLQQRVALKNIPQGHCKLVLSPQDLGHFMVHDLMKAASGKAVQGRPFLFDPSTVNFTMTGPGQGEITYHGHVGSKGGPAFAITMHAPVHSGPGPRRSQGRPSPTLPQQRILVSAQHVRSRPNPPAQTPAPSAHSASHDNAAASGNGGSAGAGAGDAQEAAVGQALSNLFNSLQLNLQGVELSQPRLRLMPAMQPASRSAAAGGDGQVPLLLEISMRLQLKELPPLNMKF